MKINLTENEAMMIIEKLQNSADALDFIIKRVKFDKNYYINNQQEMRTLADKIKKEFGFE